MMIESLVEGFVGRFMSGCSVHLISTSSTIIYTSSQAPEPMTHALNISAAALEYRYGVYSSRPGM